MSKIQFTEYRVKPMFSDEFRLLWRKLYGQLKEDALIHRAELFNAEPSRILSLVEWENDANALNHSPYKELNNKLSEIIDRRLSNDMLNRLESTR